MYYYFLNMFPLYIVWKYHFITSGPVTYYGFRCRIILLYCTSCFSPKQFTFVMGNNNVCIPVIMTARSFGFICGIFVYLSSICYTLVVLGTLSNTLNSLNAITQSYGKNPVLLSLRWRHNDHPAVSNHQPHGCLLNRLFRRRWKKTSKLRVTGLCAGNSPGPVNSPHKGPVTRKMFPFDDVIMYLGLLWSCWTIFSGFEWSVYPRITSWCGPVLVH